MKVQIRETGEIESLRIYDTSTPNNSVDVNYAADFIGNTGAFCDGQFEWDAEEQRYVCSAETYGWWADMLTKYQKLNDRLGWLKKELGSDAVYAVLHSAGDEDFADYPALIGEALDSAFGPDESP